MSNKSRALVAIISSFALLFSPVISSSLVSPASAATTIYGTTYATLGAFSGTAGPVAVNGGGYEPGTEVAAFVGTGSIPASAPKATVNASGDFGPLNVVVPVGTPQGSVTITVEGIGGVTDGAQAANSYYVVPFSPAITVTAAAHTPGTPVVVAGSGFAPEETVTLRLGSSSVSVDADEDGAFGGATLEVPRVVPASYQLTAIGADSGAQAIDYFYIDAFYPSSYPSAYYLLPGQSLEFSGQGYLGGETVEITEQDGPVLGTFNVPANTTFENVGAFEIPLSWADSSRELRLTGLTSDAVSTVTVTIGQFFPSVSPTVYYVMPGGSVAFNGSGFASGEAVDVFAGSATIPVAELDTDSSGSFEAAGDYVVPFGSGESVSFRFVGQQSNAQASTAVSVGALFPQIQPSEFYIRPGQPLVISGSGFAAGETVEVTAEGVSEEGIADEDGNIEVGPFAVPFGVTESIEFTATGQTSGGIATVLLTIGEYTPSVSASAYYLLPGNNVTFTGSGYAMGEEIEIRRGGTLVATVDADEDGAFESPALLVPFGASGPLTFSFTGASSNAVASVSITAGDFVASISADNYYVQPGTSFNVTGSGFAPDEDVEVQVGDETANGVADDDGLVATIELTMPFAEGDETSIDVVMEGQESGAKAETSITFAPFWANVSPSTWYDRAGNPVMFSGNGFANGEAVVVSLNGEEVETVLVGADGTFELSGLNLPYGAESANYAFVGQLSNANASVSIGLAPFSPSVSPSTWYGQPGSDISFTGEGFAPGETVTINRGEVELGTAEADELGEFSFDGGSLPFQGPVAYSFVGNLTGATFSFEIGVAGFYPGVELSSYYGPGGSAVEVFGSGFAPGESIAITFAGQSLGSVTATGTGAFSLSTTAPFGPAGDKAVTATGAASGAVASTGYTQAQVYSSVELGSYAVAPGEAVQVLGSGFFAGEPVQVRTDRNGSSVVHSFAASTSGNLNNSGYVLPASAAPGPLTLNIRGVNSYTEHEITIYVTGG